MLDTNDLAKAINGLEKERDEARDEAEKRLDEQEQREQELDEVRKSLGEQKQELEQELVDARNTLDLQEQKLAEMSEQIPRPRTRGFVWGLVVGGVTIGACLLLTYWILRLRKAKTGPGPAL
jgi:hypothetical protein